ncbi:hypothetical protein [Paenibacillus sp. OAS669]|uniref:hypothetical protein n=1 Tax=Paenibacillus sp. OAS669 TaxID=2663821 RepID=UPI00178ACE9F|nr:hypothetical protein [Paenibacillus sp. OAS669]MBE1446733.1 hypothetical protein [Paenibacillus sp. OAS669]
MSNEIKEVTEEDVKRIALEYISQNPSSAFKLTLVNVNKSSSRYPCWSVIFEMRNQDRNIVDGPLVLGIDEYGEVIFVG